MVVRVVGESNGNVGVALSISNTDEIEGIVNSNSVSAVDQTGEMEVMGQVVLVDSRTVFDSDVVGVDLLSLILAGYVVEVDGFTDGLGQIYATRIEVKALSLADYLLDHTEGVEVKGYVSGINTATMTFDLGGLSVNYTNANIDMAGGLVADAYVEVKSVVGFNANNELVASVVEDESYDTATAGSSENDELEIHGTITADYVDGRFQLDNTTIIVDQNTDLGSLLVTDLTTGRYVEVEGKVNANGSLLASEVELEDDVDYELSGNITNIISSANNIGIITLDDNSVIYVNNDSIMLDERDEGVVPVAQFNLTYLATGDYIKVKLHTNGVGDLIVVKLDRDNTPAP